ncbi:MAG TPA: hypothetical protein VFS43_15380 [Polyangiaceae bacterium]|nr:hypothetical protein [Polyangiaceae bacterium]
MALPALKLTHPSLEAARSRLELVINQLETAPPDRLDETLTQSIAWLEAPTDANLIWPSVAAVAGDEGQRLRYVQLADEWRAFADRISAFATTWAPRLTTTQPAIAERLARFGAERATELRELAGVLRCLMDAPDERVTEGQAAAAEALRFEAAKQLVFTLHDDAFRRLAQ